MAKKKLTVTDLIKNKEKYTVKDDVTEELYIERLDATITIKKPPKSLCLETFKMTHDPEQEENADKHMVYNIVVEPNLKDPELQKAYGCVEPYDIVDKIFEFFEIGQISGKGLELNGYNTNLKKVVNDIKN